jgi:hypothetical protein
MKETKPKKNLDSQLLKLLQKVLPKATEDARLADRIYAAVQEELRSRDRSTAFDKFCAQCPLPDLDPKSVSAVKEQLAEAFGDGDVTLKPNRKEKSLAVEVTLPDGTRFASEIKVGQSPAKDESDEEPLPPFVPFPVALPGDKELVWMLARRENISPEEAAMALNRAEEDFWGSKTGQKLLRDRVERTLSEFVSRAPASLLGDLGLKRHYKTPEAIKVLRRTGR